MDRLPKLTKQANCAFGVPETCGRNRGEKVKCLLCLEYAVDWQPVSRLLIVCRCELASSEEAEVVAEARLVLFGLPEDVEVELSGRESVSFTLSVSSE